MCRAPEFPSDEQSRKYADAFGNLQKMFFSDVYSISFLSTEHLMFKSVDNKNRFATVGKLDFLVGRLRIRIFTSLIHSLNPH